MNKIRLIIEREYLTRVRKKSFIVMSIVGPLLVVALYVIPVLLAMMDSTETHHVAILDENGELKEALVNSETIHYDFLVNTELQVAKDALLKDKYSAILYRADYDKYAEQGLVLLSVEQPSIDLKQQIGRSIEANVKLKKMQKIGISTAMLDSLHTTVNIETKKLADSGSETYSSPELAGGVGFLAALFIYFIIFMYGAQVMRGVIEEKTSRIIEVIISSVKPFELMMGKILGIALVVLTQIAIWLVLSSCLILVISQFVGSEVVLEQSSTVQSLPAVQTDMQQAQSTGLFSNFFEKLDNINPLTIFFSFIFYFLGGYLLYASLFAAIGAAVDNETDSQQFMLPVSLPMILAFMVAINTATQPNSSLAFWMSMIPFTSPITMMVRIPHGVPLWELLLSMSLLVLCFLFTTYMAAKIYRVGILMYGKKPTYKEIYKWLKY